MAYYIKKENISILSRLFSPQLMKDIVHKGKSSLLGEIIEYSKVDKILPKNASLNSLFQVTYDILLKQYRNEYVYKNALTNKILLGRHSLNTSFMINELHVGACKADSVIINGTSNVYEIKSEYDSFERLERQLKAYKKVFDKIQVVTSESQANKLEKTLESEIGILVLSKKGTLSNKRLATSRKQKISPEAIFNVLRNNEYKRVVKKHFGFIPDVPNTKSYEECLKLFIQIPPQAAHDYMVTELRKRGNCKVLKEFINSVPESLKAYSIKSGLNKKEMLYCLSLFNKNYESFCI